VAWWRENDGVPRPVALDDDAIAGRLADLTGWSRDGDMIRKAYSCGGFADAIAFVVRIGFLAEAADHHPDIDIRWRNVSIALSTHDAGGLTALDFDLAAKIDEVAS
jgi:4a-hydroxytetrahydrobiopterin dehydratase